MAAPDRWEMGSSFHTTWEHLTDQSWLPAGAVLFGSGRSALSALLADGIQRQGWRRLLLPSYYCHDVTASSRRLIDIEFYDDSPLAEASQLALGPTDVAVVIEYFGSRCNVEVSGGTTVLDRSHDLIASWAYEREPEFVFASLRKTIPVPDGGIAWSPSGIRVPQPGPIDDGHAAASGLMLAGMSLKSAYLAGAPIQKGVYLSMLEEAEHGLATVDAVPASPFTTATVPFTDLAARAARRDANRAVALGLLELPRWAQVLDCTSHVVMSMDTADRCARVKSALVARSVYPAVLWPAHEAQPEPADPLTARLLALHIDARYDIADLERVTVLLMEALEEADHGAG